ncbi:MAG TPA: imidazoleglycerol-phosphate dehydratase HisB [Candidatus Hydrogenedentes bacterium]|nr:imidazoleglycerol-phosphate dehydratase HisB [Candidatus Hydrogenedentota bacterium]
MREQTVERVTGETSIRIRLNLDGSGVSRLNTGIGFFDHMLDQLSRHGLFDLEVEARGDLSVDAHHTVEDVGICLGKAFNQALGEPRGIRRYGHAVAPMDEALAEAAVDLSGRPWLTFSAVLLPVRLGGYDVELTEEFFRAFVMNARCTLHLVLRAGKNQHHCVEALFKAVARALREAVEPDPRRPDTVPSTKGMLET